MPEVVVQSEELKKLVIDKFINAGIPEEDASIVADVLIHANLRNVNSHGVLRTEHYMKRLSAGGLNPTPEITIKETGPVSAIVDGDDGMGHIVAKRAMDQAIELAEKNGVGMIGVTNSSHCGALSYFVEQAAEADLIGMAMTHTDKVVVPFGGKERYFGTNPIAYGFPTNQHQSVILDMATSNVAFGKILHAKESGQTIPRDWGVDEEGNATTEPDKVSALLPFAGPKGYGLAMVVDIFSGILTGSNYGPHINPMYGEYEKMRELGHFIMAINPDMFIGKEAFKANMDAMIEEIHQQKPAEGFDKVMVPGEPEQLHKNERLKSGIPVTESVYNYLANK